MAGIIEWCNLNNGFMNGVLSLLTLVASGIAIIVSVRTARLPYKKKIKLSSSLQFYVMQNNHTGDVEVPVKGITVNAVNVGNRNANITFLGFAIKETTGKLQMLHSINRNLGGTGILEPTRISSVEYSVQEMMALKQFSDRACVYCYAVDSEGKNYKKKYGRSDMVIKNLLKFKHYN